MISASALKQQIRIERMVASDDGYGGRVVSWTEVATVFAHIQPVQLAVNERELAEQRQANAGYRVTIRARNDISAAMRLVWKERLLQVHSLHEHDAVITLLAYEENV